MPTVFPQTYVPVIEYWVDLQGEVPAIGSGFHRVQTKGPIGAGSKWMYVRRVGKKGQWRHVPWKVWEAIPHVPVTEVATLEDVAVAFKQWKGK